MKKLFAFVVLLCLASLSFAGQKSFTVVIDKPATVGSAKLAPGEYKVKVDGANAVFTNTFNYKSVSTAVKVETGDKKFKETAVDSVRNGAGENIQSITVGGTSTKLDFSKQPVASN